MLQPPKIEYQQACPPFIMNLNRHWHGSFSDIENNKISEDLLMQVTEMFNIRTAALFRMPSSIPTCTTRPNLVLNYPSA